MSKVAKFLRNISIMSADNAKICADIIATTPLIADLCNLIIDYFGGMYVDDILNMLEYPTIYNIIFDFNGMFRHKQYHKPITEEYEIITYDPFEYMPDDTWLYHEVIPDWEIAFIDEVIRDLDTIPDYYMSFYKTRDRRIIKWHTAIMSYVFSIYQICNSYIVNIHDPMFIPNTMNGIYTLIYVIKSFDIDSRPPEFPVWDPAIQKFAEYKILDWSRNTSPWQM